MNTIATKEDVTLTIITCGNCGVVHGIPEVMFNSCYEEGGFWTCPNGHSRGYNEGSIRKQLEKEKKRREWAEKNNANLIDEVDATNRKLSAQKGVNTRMKNRVKNGVCPCCNRTFANLAKHMKGQHPEFQAEAEG